MATKTRRWSYEFTGLSNSHVIDARTLGIAGGQSHENLGLRLEIDVLSVPFGGSASEVRYARAVVYLLLVDGEVVSQETAGAFSGGFDNGENPETPPTIVVAQAEDEEEAPLPDMIAISITNANIQLRCVVDVKARVLERGALV